jgi:hypothetical protein
MKIILTESQYKLFLEGTNIPKYILRRISEIELAIDKYIDETDPSDFEDQFEYADNIISWVINDIGIDELDDEGKVRDDLIDLYSDMLFDVYYDSVGFDDED